MADLLLMIDKLTVGLAHPGAPKPLVRDISLTVGPGEAVGIVGESGSGKSLTAQAIGGMLQADLAVLSGHIYLDGVELTQLSEKALHRLRGDKVAYVFQDPLNALNPTRSIGGHLIDVIRHRHKISRRKAWPRAVAALQAVGITQAEDRMHAYPHQLSGGMRQRVLIAMSLICEPSLLIADEPTTALDVTVRARIIDLFHEVLRRRISVLFISHNLDLVLEFCGAVAVMYGGRLMEKGTAIEIGSAAQHPYTVALMDCVPRLQHNGERLQVIPGSPPTNAGTLPGCPFAARCPRALGRCSEEFPAATELSPTHQVACWNPHEAKVQVQ